MNRRLGFLVIPAVAVLLAAFGLPVSWLLLRSVSTPVWGLQNFVYVFERPVYLQVLLNTAVISAVVTLCCALIGYPFAYTMANGSERTRRLLTFLVLIPFWTSILVRSFGWVVLLQRRGLVNQLLLATGLADEPLQLVYNRFGTLVGMVHILLPFMVFPLYTVMTRIDPSFAQAASTLGAGPVRAFMRSYLPLSMPGLFTGATLVFISALGYFITPALLGGPRDMMIAQLIEQQVSNFGNWGVAGALSVLLLLAATVVLVAARRLFGLRDLWGAA